MAFAKLRTRAIPVLAGLIFVALFAFFAQPAHADTRTDLQDSYQSAVIKYESAVEAQNENEAEIVKIDADIAETEHKIDLAQDEISDTAVTMYKETRGGQALLDMLLESSSFDEVVVRFEQYDKITNYYHDKAMELAQEKRRLDTFKKWLEDRRAEIAKSVDDARLQAEAAAIALLDNTHSDGAQYHQAQGNDSNCGATAFIVAVNTILHENRYIDNVAVWEGPGFNGDSTSDLAWRGANWLLANGLQDLISIGTVSGDIHTAQEMRDWLEEGYVIVASSGPGSTWRFADGSESTGNFPYGHWVAFYCYQDGIFYCNDSSTTAAMGAGIAYNEEQMQSWLDGRSNHFATALKKI